MLHPPQLWDTTADCVQGGERCQALALVGFQGRELRKAWDSLCGLHDTRVAPDRTEQTTPKGATPKVESLLQFGH